MEAALCQRVPHCRERLVQLLRVREAHHHEDIAIRVRVVLQECAELGLKVLQSREVTEGVEHHFPLNVGKMPHGGLLYMGILVSLASMRKADKGVHLPAE